MPQRHKTARPDTQHTTHNARPTHDPRTTHDPRHCHDPRQTSQYHTRVPSTHDTNDTDAQVSAVEGQPTTSQPTTQQHNNTTTQQHHNKTTNQRDNTASKQSITLSDCDCGLWAQTGRSHGQRPLNSLTPTNNATEGRKEGEREGGRVSSVLRPAEPTTRHLSPLIP